MPDRIMWLYAGPTHKWVASYDVEIEDVGEDLQGYDNYTFTYKGETYQSRGVLGSRPG